MHRIDRVVDEIEATLRGRGPESDELRAECLALARDMILEYENAGLKTWAVSKTARLLPRKILPQYGIKPINETLWFHLAILAALAGLYLVDRFLVEWVWDSYLGVIKNSVALYVLFWVSALPEHQMWIGRVGQDDFSYLLRKVRFEDVARVFYSFVGGVTLELGTGKRVRLGAVRPKKYHLLQRVLDGMGPDVEVDQRVMELVAKAGEKLSIPRRKFWRKVIAGIGIFFFIYYLILLTVRFWFGFYSVYIVIFPVVGISSVGMILILKVKYRPYFQYYLSAIAVDSSIAFSFIKFIMFSDDLLLCWLLIFGAAISLLLSIRFILRPFLGRGYAVTIICCAFIAPLLTVASKAVMEWNVETVAVYEGMVSVNDIYLVDESMLVSGTMGHEFGFKDMLYKTSFSSGEVEKAIYARDNSFFTWHFVSPDRKLMMSMVEEGNDKRKDDSYALVLTELFTLEGQTVVRKISASPKPKLSQLFDYWSPGDKRFLYDIYVGRDANYFYYDLEDRENRPVNFTVPKGSVDPFWMDEIHIVYSRQEEKWGSGQELRSCSWDSVTFFTYDVETGDTETLLSLKEPVYCSDARDIPGRTMVYVTENGLLAIDLKTMKTYSIFLEHDRERLRSLGIVSQRADNNTVIVSFNKAGEETGTLGLGLIDLEKRSMKFIPAEHPCPIWDLEASPDKANVAYTLNTFNCPQYENEHNPPGELWVCDLQTGTSSKILSMNRHSISLRNLFAWSLDSKYIYAPSGIMTTSIPGSDMTRIVKIKVE